MSDNGSVIPPVRFDAAPMPGWHYAGFWARFWALSIDMFLMSFVALIFVVMLPFVALTGQMLTWPMGMAGLWSVDFMTSSLPLQIAVWLYFAGMESSAGQATIGKRMLGLRVMRQDGVRLSFGRASGRYFGKYLSTAIWCLGFVMAAFTARKQALHDVIAETLVMQRVALVDLKGTL